MIRKEYTLEDTHDRYEVDVADGGLNDIDEESFLADTCCEGVSSHETTVRNYSSQALGARFHSSPETAVRRYPSQTRAVRFYF